MLIFLALLVAAVVFGSSDIKFAAVIGLFVSAVMLAAGGQLDAVVRQAVALFPL